MDIWLCVRHLRVHELEEQLKDQETRAEQNVQEGLRRHREAYSKMERDKNTQIELLTNRLEAHTYVLFVFKCLNLLVYNLMKRYCTVRVQSFSIQET